jgi:hypothetical protein
MAEKRVNDPRARQMIALQTRQSKNDIDPDVLKAEWQQCTVSMALIRWQFAGRLAIASESRLQIPGSRLLKR